MQSINALSFAPDVNKWLTNSHQPRILHVFDQACNLINEHKNILSIVTPQIGNGPFNLVIKEDIFFSDYLNIESKISIQADQLNIGNLTILTNDVELWSAQFDWKMLHSLKDNIRIQLISLPQFLFTNYQSPISNLLVSSLAKADVPSSITAAKQLAGLGQGLTPSGDDFILGALLAVWIIHPQEMAMALAEEITNIAVPLTTSLSAAYLKSTGRGEAGILWHNFFDALGTDDSYAIEYQITRLLSIGHTSGADALAGFIGTFISYAEIEEKSCPS